MMKKKLTAIILILVTLILSTYFILDNYSVISEQINKFIGKKYNTTNNIGDAIEREEQLYQKETSFHSDDYYFPIDLTTKEIEFTIKNYYITNDLPLDVNKNDVRFSEKKFYENGILKEDYLYLIIDTKIKNLTGDQYEYLVNSLHCVYVDEYMNIIWPIVEIVYFTQQGQASNNPSEMYHYIFEKSEQIDSTLILVVNKNELLKYDLYIEVNNDGSYVLDEDDRLHKVIYDKEILNEGFFKN